MEQTLNKKEFELTSFKSALHKGKVKFSYTKKDGTVREALGTLDNKIYGEENEPKGTGYTVPEYNIRYFDLEKEGWRSFNADNLLPEWKIMKN